MRWAVKERFYAAKNESNYTITSSAHTATGTGTAFHGDLPGAANWPELASRSPTLPMWRYIRCSSCVLSNYENMRLTIARSYA